MIERLIRWGVPRFLGGPSKSWVFTSAAVYAYRLAKGRTGRREVIDVGSVGKGKQIVIDHVKDSHASQLKAEKQVKKSAKKEKRRVRKADRSEKRQARRDRRAARAEQRQVKRAERVERADQAEPESATTA